MLLHYMMLRPGRRNGEGLEGRAETTGMAIRDISDETSTAVLYGVTQHYRV